MSISSIVARPVVPFLENTEILGFGGKCPFFYTKNVGHNEFNGQKFKALRWYSEVRREYHSTSQNGTNVVNITSNT